MVVNYNITIGDDMKTATKHTKTVHKSYLTKKLSFLPKITKISRVSNRMKKNTEYYIASKPYKTAGLVFLASLCVGFIANR